jgi:hypothetical protein
MVPAPRSLHDLSVLVIDDHRDTVDMFQQYLTLCGAQVTGAGSAKAALGTRGGVAISGERYDQLDPASGFAGYFFKPVLTLMRWSRRSRPCLTATVGLTTTFSTPKSWGIHRATGRGLIEFRGGAITWVMSGGGGVL